MRSDITTNEWSACLGHLRGARALILRDAESFHEAATVLEQVGHFLSGEIRNGLWYYEPELLDLANSTGGHELAKTPRLFNVVREARNMAVHDGAWARHLSSRLIDLFLILEEAIMSKMNRVEDIMVRDPVVAEPWQMVAQIRRIMLANSFSHLPVFLSGKWLLVSDAVVMRFLRGAANSTERKSRLSMQICKAIEAKEIKPASAACCQPQDTLDQLLAKMEDHPVLVTQDVDGVPRLLGIVTPFDLL